MSWQDDLHVRQGACERLGDQVGLNLIATTAARQSLSPDRRLDVSATQGCHPEHVATELQASLHAREQQSALDRACLHSWPLPDIKDDALHRAQSSSNSAVFGLAALEEKFGFAKAAAILPQAKFAFAHAAAATLAHPPSAAICSQGLSPVAEDVGTPTADARYRREAMKLPPLDLSPHRRPALPKMLAPVQTPLTRPSTELSDEPAVLE